jgi:hypothetical protein
MNRLVLYSDGPYDMQGWDVQGRRYDRFFGGGCYRFQCSVCGGMKENGWVRYPNGVEVCTECAMVVYELAEVLR